jgi:hypothetical protein
MVASRNVMTFRKYFNMRSDASTRHKMFLKTMHFGLDHVNNDHINYMSISCVKDSRVLIYVYAYAYVWHIH